MRFYRSSRRRFSATPRKSWRRARGTGTRETRSQYAQVSIETGFSIEDDATDNDPSFLVQALTPWANAPAGGYDRAWELRGLIFDLSMYPHSHETATPSVVENLYSSTEIGQVFSRVISCFFVDQADSSGAPVSVGGTNVGPFITTPPIANPAAAPADDEFMPTRMLKRKFSSIQTGSCPALSTGSKAYDIGISNGRWSGTLRKRVSIASRQGLYLGWYGLPPPASYPNGIERANVLIQGSVVFYYRLGR